VSLLDLDAFERAPLQHIPCDFVVVPRFVRAEALAAVNRDFPSIAAPANFSPEAVTCGPAFDLLRKELESPELRARFAAKFGMDLEPLRLEMEPAVAVACGP
jgi:SM-20-related protein